MFKLITLAILGLVSYEATAGRSPVPVAPLPYTLTVQNTSNDSLYAIAYASSTPATEVAKGKSIQTPISAISTPQKQVTKITVDPSKTLIVVARRASFGSGPLSNKMTVLCAVNTTSQTKKFTISENSNVISCSAK